jgi:hypothetical protein
MPVSRLIPVCAVACAVTLFAACTSSSSKAPSTPSASPTAPSSSSAPLSSSSAAPSSATPAPLTQLKKIVLASADLPAGWKGTPYAADPTDAAFNAAMAKCTGSPNTEPDKVAEAHSDDFALGDAGISSSAASYRSQRDLDADVAMVRSPKLAACYKQVTEKLATGLPAGTTIDSVSAKFAPGPGAGPANVVATGAVTLKFTASGQQVELYLTVAFIIGPLIQAEVDTNNVGKPLSASVVNSAVAAVADRAAKG